ncbi:hypothetical protein D9M69_635410 [compost metagenome]
MNAGLNHQAGRRGAALAGGVEGAVQRAVDGDVQIRVVHDDERVLATHFQLAADHALGRDCGDARTDALGAGKGNGVDILGVQDRLADGGAFAHHQVEHAIG